MVQRPQPTKKSRKGPAQKARRGIARAFSWLASVVVLMALLAAAALVYWLQTPLVLQTPVVELRIEKGTSSRTVANEVVKSGVDTSAFLLYAWFRGSGKARQIKAGSYELKAGLTPMGLLDKLVNGEEAMSAVTMVEGWTFKQVRAALAKAPDLQATTANLTEAQIMSQLGRPGLHPEGQFFPDTYTYAKGSSDLAVLARSLKAMDKQLTAAWEGRTPDLPLTTKEQALILASVVEKETGLPADRASISAVFNNRLKIGMRLQTDPTVIYGLGDQFDGNLRKADLLTDTPYNTYTRSGLPPTPIAMPGKAALLATLHPAPIKALYFVAKGDGASHFSLTLDEHNKAVNQFILGK